MFGNKTLERLEQMLEDALDGTFQESCYDESKLSRLESKWKQYLTTSCLVKDNLEKEKANVKGLVSDISHQTKTPMTNIKMYAQLLEEGLKKGDDSQNQMLIEEIINQTNRLEFLIQSLTKLSRLETNVVEVKPIYQGLAPLVQQAVSAIMERAQKKQIEIKIASKLTQKAWYDLKWTTEALVNILDNAVKYSPFKSVITIRICVYEMYAAICVEDEGIGIQEAEIPKIFGRFYRSECVQQEDGVGIGLHLAREIVSRQDGYIRVKSKEGEGSSFQIFLKIFQNC